jgi:AraC-like DNA-binding protein
VIAAEVGLDRAIVDDPDGRVPHAQLYALWEAVVARAPRADLPLLGAKHYEPSDYGLVGFVAMNSPTLGEALSQVVRFLGLWTDDPSLRLRPDGALVVTYRARPADRMGLRCTAEAMLAEVLHGSRMVAQTMLVPIEVRFAHPAPPDTAAHVAYLGGPVRFDCESCEMILRAEDLALPLPKADPQLGAFLHKAASEALDRRGPIDGPSDQLRALIADELQRGVPALDDLARRMGTTERTLRRRLEENGTSFRALLDETRADLARGYIRDRRPLAEVAFLVGFTDPSTFHRAFKRWTGTTPKAWRDRR